MNKCKRFLALFLVLCMMLSVLPISAFASEGSTDVSGETSEGEISNEESHSEEEEPASEEEKSTPEEEESVLDEGDSDPNREKSDDAPASDDVVEDPAEEVSDDDETGEISGDVGTGYGLEKSGDQNDEGVSAASITISSKPDGGTTTDNPFVKGTGGSNSFRIPAMVTLNDGTIVAAADARWNTTYDGGGLDTIVSYSTDNGVNWNYTFANYLGDNGNTYNGSGSTAFIDPALATDGSTVYMLCDLYPYGVALNGSGNTAPSTAVGFNSDGKLLLSTDNTNYNYYLDGTVIRDSNGNEVSGLTVDAYFNVTGTYNNTTYNTNLFFSDSPFKVVRTGYLYLTKSTDGGESWSEPTLIPNVKTTSEQVCLVGPGRGLVTGGMIIFPVYSYNGSSSTQQMGFVYSSDGGETWTRSANFTGDSWSSEAAVVELEDGTLRFFYRNGNSKLYYADYTWGTGWGSAVNTGIATNSNTQISAISLTKTVDGQQVILVSCPTGSNNAGSADSSGSARVNGRIQIGLVDSESYTMTWKTPIDVTTNNSQFMYSCLTALTDSEGNETGEIAILYENQESAWGTGDNCYYTMAFATYDLSESVPFDENVDENIFVDGAEGNNTSVQINFGAEGYTSVAVVEANPDVLTGQNYVAYDISVEGFSGTSAIVTIPLKGAFTQDVNLRAVYINENGAISETIQGTRDTKMDTFSFEVRHFSTYAVVADESGDTPTYTDTKDIALTVGETKKVTDENGNYQDTYTGAGLNTDIASVDVVGTDGLDSTTNEWQLVTIGVSGINTNDKYLIVSASSGNAYALTSSGGTTQVSITDGVIPVESVATDSNAVFTFAGSGSSWTIYGTTGYLYPTATRSWGSWSYKLSAGQSTAQTVTISGTSGVTISRSVTSGWNSTTSYLTLGSTAGASNSSDTVYLFKLVQETTKTDPVTTITFTGVSAGKTSVVVGETLYNITVSRKTETVNLTVGNTAAYTDSSSNITVADSTVASAILSDGKLNITGLKEGTTTVTTDTTVYTVTVSDGTPISIKENETTTISVTLEDGQTVEWSSADSSYVGVAGKYDTTTGAYTNEAILAGQNVTSSPVTVTATIKDANGTVVRTEKWLVTVTEGDPDDNTSSKGIYFNIDTIENCTVYYSINGGELIPVNGTGVTTGNWTGNGTYTGHFNIMFFAAPDEGYALTYMSISGSADQYYTLANGNPDGTGSDAWPFTNANASEIPSSSDDSAWKTINGSKHGFRWALLEGNMTIDQMKVMFSNAIALGCDGATTITKNNNNEGMGSASSPTVCKFVAQKLPTVDKTITSITRDGVETTYTDGMKVKIGDTINYSVVVTRYATNATYGTITYDNEKLTDALTSNNGISNPDMGTSTTSDKTYTYTTGLTLTNENFGTVVKRGAITNEVEFSYTYSSQYSAGSMDAKASAVAEVTVDIPSYVVDFGLPVEIDLLENGNGDGEIIRCAHGLYGTAVLNNGKTGFTYTPTKVMQDIDYIEFTYVLNNEPTYEYTYTVAIYPATTVNYEEGFLNFQGDWTDQGGKYGEDVKQTTQVLGSSKDNYGYDTAISSNGKDATTNSMGASASFTFTGTGFEVYANCTEKTGYVAVQVKDASGSTVKYAMINTVVKAGNSTATAGQIGNFDSEHIISLRDLPHSTYTVTLRKVYDTADINIDGFRVFGTVADSSVYAGDNEANPTFVELRDQVLAGVGIKEDSDSVYKTEDQILQQVFDDAGTTAGVVVLSLTDTDAKDLLENGSKNALHLYAGQAVTFKLADGVTAQIGLHAPKGGVTYKLNNNSGSISASTDMFYYKNLSGEVTITNTADKNILSITILKTFGSNGSIFTNVTENQIQGAVLSLRSLVGDPVDPEEGTDPTDPVTPTDPEPTEPEPTEPEEPEVTYADASLMVSLVDYSGKEIASAELTANGVEGETKAFTAEEVLAAAKANVPDDYVLVDESKVTGAEVAYGENGTVSVQIGKVATLKITYVNLFGRKVGSATISKVQTADGKCTFSASDIKNAAPSGRLALRLTSVSVSYGSEKSVTVTVF